MFQAMAPSTRTTVPTVVGAAVLAVGAGIGTELPTSLLPAATTTRHSTRPSR